MKLETRMRNLLNLNGLEEMEAHKGLYGEVVFFPLNGKINGIMKYKNGYYYFIDCDEICEYPSLLILNTYSERNFMDLLVLMLNGELQGDEFTFNGEQETYDSWELFKDNFKKSRD